MGSLPCRSCCQLPFSLRELEVDERSARMSMTLTDRTEAAGMPMMRQEPGWLFRGRVPGLDGLRGISILLVLLAHTARTHDFAAPALIHAVARRASIGVDVFFVISGFL